MLYRRVEEGGLGLHHVQSKALAHLISTFIQTAANKRFRSSLYHSWLYRFHIEGEANLPNPGFTPYYDRNFFEVIKEAYTQPQHNPPEMTVSQWYQFLLSRNLTKQVIDEVPVLVPCRIEERYPQICWADSYRISRLKGLSPQNKSFLFKLTHELLPSKERLNHLNLAPTSLCWCSSECIETYQHMFFDCEKNSEAGSAILNCVRSYNEGLTNLKCLRLELNADDPFLLASVDIISTGLEHIFLNRRQKKTTSLFSIRTELETSVAIKRKSRSRRLRECAEIMQNMITNFLN